LQEHHLSATYLSGHLRGWFCHTTFEWSHLEPRVGFVF